VSPGYTAHLRGVLRAGRDVWGERLLGARNGPTLAAARRFLPPLLYAAGHGGERLTASGVYYLPFTLPYSVGGSRGFGLHVADGSQIIVRRVGGPSLTVGVGPGGTERYGSCLPRLGPPRLADGYLPILQVSYRDAAGARYAEESFVGRLAGSRSLVSFVRVDVDASAAARAVAVRLATSTGQTIVQRVPRGSRDEIVAAFVHSGARLAAVDAETYGAARADVVAFWQQQLAGVPMYDVPERAVLNAEKALVVQELEMTWRYSVGNVYEELSYAEALDVAQVMAAYGYGPVSRQILRYTLRRLSARYTNWRAGERLVAGAQYFFLTRDAAYVTEETPGLAAVVERLRAELDRSTNGLLPRERYSSDIADEIYSLQGQTLVWQGLLATARLWEATGHVQLAGDARALALRLQGPLRRAVRASERRLPDGSLFVPAALLDGGRPFARLTDSVAGTYWNLVAPYALASGFFAPRGAEARGLLHYLLLHGSRLLGLVRAGAYRLARPGQDPCGTDEVYGTNVSRFLADADQPDQLALSLYGILAGALTPGTYVTGEAASVAPLGRERYRTMYLPPNNDGGAAFLETLRLMLVHETRGPEGAPAGIELAYATPRAWLADRRRIAVHAAPTSFGAVSYSIERHGSTVTAQVDLPRVPPPVVRIRLRLPRGVRVAAARIDGRPAHVEADGTLTLPRRGGTILVVASLG
jgi:hypothetical protein